MKTRSDVDPDKLRGGYYTPDRLVDLCLDRVAEHTRGAATLAVLEPSAGDGAFVRGLARSGLGPAVSSLVAIEPVAREANRVADAIATARLPGRVRHESAIGWAASTRERFDVAVGNPPFVRFQFVDRDERQAVDVLGRRLGVELLGVANLWLPVLLGALSRLRTGGAFAFVVPAECLTGVAAGSLRAWLLRHGHAIRIDLFPPGSFPGVLQEVVVLSGRVRRPTELGTRLAIVDHAANNAPDVQVHHVPDGSVPWTRFLLRPAEIEAFERAASRPGVVALGEVATFGVAAVTGANDFFSVDESTALTYELAPWSRPLLPRIRHAPGLAYTPADHAAAGAAGARVHLLDFSAERADPEVHEGPAAYLASGVARGLPLRYKCRIRQPWFRVPHIRPGELLLSKRSHRYPRLVRNDVGAVTTDTIYRGTPRAAYADRVPDLVAGFHNSLTLLAAELEGRSFGGGVLELVPTEVGRLLVPMVGGSGDALAQLDGLARSSTDPDALVAATDELILSETNGWDPGDVAALSSAHRHLQARRLARNGRA